MNQAMQLMRKLYEQQQNNQALLHDKTYSSVSEQDLIKLEMNGKFKVLSLTINEGLIDADDVITLEEMLTDTVNKCVKNILQDYDNAVPDQLKQIYAMEPSGQIEAAKKEWNDKSFNYECADGNLTVVIRGSMLIDKLTIKPDIVKPDQKAKLEEILANDLSDAFDAVYDSWDENNNATLPLNE